MEILISNQNNTEVCSWVSNNSNVTTTDLSVINTTKVHSFFNNNKHHN
jgi:hypothetical protein